MIPPTSGGQSDGGIGRFARGHPHYPKKVKKLLTSGANLRPDTTAIDPALLPVLDKMWPVVKNDSVRSKQFRLLVEQPHIKTAELRKIKADVMIMGGDRDAYSQRAPAGDAQEHPGLIALYLPGTTLFVYEDRTKWFMEILFDFFDTTASPNYYGSVV